MAIIKDSCDSCIGNTASACTAGLGNVAGTGDAFVDTYTINDVLGVHCDSGYQVYNVIPGRKNRSFFATLLFDNVDGEGNIIPRAIDSKVEGTLTLDGKSIMWGEREHKNFEANVTAATLAGNNVFVDQPEAFAIGDNVKIVYCDGCCVLEAFRTVTNVATGATVEDNYITVDGAALTISTTDCSPMVYFINHPYACNDTIVSAEITDLIVDMKSNFQIFAEKICFTNDEINICYSAQDAAQRAEDRMSQKKQRLYEGLLNTFFYGTNTRKVVGGKDVYTTMGIINEIQKAHDAGANIVRDLGGSPNVDVKLMALIEELEKIPLINANVTTIDVVATDTFMRKLIMSNAAWSRLTGCTQSCNMNSAGVKSFGSVYDIELPGSGVMVKFHSDAALSNQYRGQSLAIIIPQGWAAFYSKANEIKDGRVVARNEVFKMRELPTTADIVCETCYAIVGEIAFAFVGVPSGMWRLIKWF